MCKQNYFHKPFLQILLVAVAFVFCRASAQQDNFLFGADVNEAKGGADGESNVIPLHDRKHSSVQPSTLQPTAAGNVALLLQIAESHRLVCRLGQELLVR